MSGHGPLLGLFLHGHVSLQVFPRWDLRNQLIVLRKSLCVHLQSSPAASGCSGSSQPFFFFLVGFVFFVQLWLWQYILGLPNHTEMYSCTFP